MSPEPARSVFRRVLSHATGGWLIALIVFMLTLVAGGTFFARSQFNKDQRSPQPAATVPEGSGPISTPAASTSCFLDQVQPVGMNSEASWAIADINGETYKHSLLIEFNPYGGNIGGTKYAAAADFNLARDFTIFEAVAGVEDSSPAQDRIRFEVLADNTIVFDEILALGTSKPVQLDVRGVLRLRLLTDAVDHQNGRGESAAWGDPRLTGACP